MQTACPAGLPANRLLTVHSDECSLCLECVQACPVANTLTVQPIYPRRHVRPLVIALAIAGVLLFTVVLGKLSGHWQSSVTPQQMARQIQYLQFTTQEHP